ncbi:MAG: PQQ-like beta-propeller repeat protein, partial [Actinobacteria bacterium]|nr:PQQ-like beta-propeller repeat protein [Actinomycetota bacterium]
MRKIVVMFLALGLLLFSASLVSAQDANEWSQYQKDKANTGSMSVTVPDEGIVSSKTSAIEARDGSEPVVAGSRAYVYTGVDDTSGSIVCLDLATGEKAWETEVEPPTFWSSSSPAVSGGFVYIGSGSKVCALNALDGSRVWERYLGSGAAVVNSSPTIDGDRLFIGDWNNNNDGRYLCLDAKNGDIIWEFALDADCHAQSTPAVDGGMVFVGQFGANFGVPEGKVWCLDRNSGKPVSTWGPNGYFTPEDNLDVTGSVSVYEDYIYFTD